ncbi:MAG: hypothetical protein R3Y12_04555 [Clostridia bacterium]
MDITKLCRNDEEKLCVYCTFSIEATEPDRVLCKKRGMMYKTDFCKKYKYNPTKRKPPARVKMKRAVNLDHYSL